MTMERRVLSDVLVGSTFFGLYSGKRYTKITSDKVRLEEGADKGSIWIWRPSDVVLIKK